MTQSGIDRDNSPGASQNLRYLLKAHARQHFNILPAFRQSFCPRLFVRGAPRQLNADAAVGQQIEKLLLIHGCKPIETEGQPFDPTVHEAILQQPVAGTPPGTVVGVATKGYRLHDRVVRPAQVIVSKEV